MTINDPKKVIKRDYQLIFIGCLCLLFSAVCVNGAYSGLSQDFTVMLIYAVISAITGLALIFDVFLSKIILKKD